MPNPSDNPFYNSATGMIPTWARGGGSPTPTPANNSVAASMAGFSPYSVPSSSPRGGLPPGFWAAGSGMGPKEGRFNTTSAPLPFTGGEGDLPGGANLVQMGPGGWYKASQSPGEAFMRTLGRNMVPGVSLGVDRPEAGGGMDTWWKKLLGSAPWVGPAIAQPAFAANRASEAMGRGESINPQEESMFSRGMTTVGAGLRLAPGGQATDMLKNIYTGVRAAQGIPDFFGFNTGQILSGLAGTGVGAAGRNIFSQPSWTQTGMGGGGIPGGGDMGGGYAPSENNFASSMIPSSMFQEERGGS